MNMKHDFEAPLVSILALMSEKTSVLAILQKRTSIIPLLEKMVGHPLDDLLSDDGEESALQRRELMDACAKSLQMQFVGLAATPRYGDFLRRYHSCMTCDREAVVDEFLHKIKALWGPSLMVSPLCRKQIHAIFGVALCH